MRSFEGGLRVGAYRPAARPPPADLLGQQGPPYLAAADLNVGVPGENHLYQKARTPTNTSPRKVPSEDFRGPEAHPPGCAVARPTRRVPILVNREPR